MNRWQRALDNSYEQLDEMHNRLHELDPLSSEYVEQFEKIQKFVEELREFCRWAFAPVGLADYPD